jgi:serine phosphatase RsbU (regulator of sigma subunit)
MTDSNYIYHQIYKKNFFSNNSQIICNHNKIYINDQKYILIYNEKNKSIKKINAFDNSYFDYIFKFNNNIFAFVPYIGIFKIINDSINNNFITFPEEQISFALNINSKYVLIATNNNRFFKFSNNNISELKNLKLQYLKNKKISGAKILSKNIFVIYTMNAGLIFINSKSLKIIKIINTFSGLSDNQINSLFIDKEQGLWFANDYGIYRFDYQLPIYNYGLLPGYDGNIITTQILDTTLYVFTTQGVYFLTKASSVKDFIKRIKKRIPVKTQGYKINFKPQNNIEPEPTQENNTQSNNNNVNNQGFFKRLARRFFHKKKKQNSQTPQQPKESSNKTKNLTNKKNKTNYTKTQIIRTKTITIKLKYKKKTDNLSSSLYFYFKKIQGINSKTIKTTVFKQNLIVATTRGLYAIKNNKVTTIDKNMFFTDLYISPISNKIYVSSLQGLFELTKDNDKFSLKQIISNSILNNYITSISDDKYNLWIGTKGYVFKINKLNKKIKIYPINPNFMTDIIVLNIKGKILAYTPSAIYKFNRGLDSMIFYEKFNSQIQNKIYFIKSQSSTIWFYTPKSWHYQSLNSKIDSSTLSYFNLFNNIQDIKLDNKKNIWICTKNNSIYKIDQSQKIKENSEFKIYISNYSINDKKYKNTSIKIKYSPNQKLSIKLNCPYYINTKNIKYQYAIGQNTQKISKILWSDPSEINHFDIPLNIGTQYIYFRATNVFEQKSNIIRLKIIVNPPFWKTNIFRLLIILFIIIIAYIIIRIRQKALIQRNLELERIVEERTSEIQQKNNELQAQKEEISSQNEILIKQKEEIEKVNTHIQQSINYARRIQRAFFPDQKILSTYFAEHLLISLPKDIVSGDFYWFKAYGNKLYLSVADCTGHGVPGAFLSMFGIAYLNDMAAFYSDISTADILNKMRENVISYFQEKEDNDVRDGMDISLLIIDFEKLQINFSGAYQNLYLFRNEQLQIIKGNKMPVGYSWKNHILFENHFIQIQENDIIYLFSDGYADQFGGKDYTKFQIVNLRKILQKIIDLPLEAQKQILLETFFAWKNGYKQMDDVTILAFKI